MRKVLITKGLPASGKTTWAREFIKKNPNYKRINKDELRAMLDDGKWSKKNEQFVVMARDNLMSLAVLNGWDVIIDDTNLHPKHEQNIKNEIDLLNETMTHHDKNPKPLYKVEIKDFTDVPVEECIKRDQERQNYVGEKVIRQMYRQFLVSKAPKLEYDPKKPFAIICDLDGTLALFGSANPYDRDFTKDKVNKPVAKVVNTFLNETDDEVIIVSARSNKFLDQTKKWLEENSIDYDKLIMPREDGDNRKDIILKQEIYEKHIKDKYNVRFVLDDRDQVVDFWRSQGLTVFQVDYGDF